MDPGLGVWGLAVAIAGHAVLWFFKSPKETSQESERRITALELAYGQLSIKVEGTYSRHDEALVNLTSAVEKLTHRFERWTEAPRDHHRAR